MRPLAIDALRRSALLAASLPGIRIRLTHDGDPLAVVHGTDGRRIVDGVLHLGAAAFRDAVADAWRHQEGGGRVAMLGLAEDVEPEIHLAVGPCGTVRPGNVLVVRQAGAWVYAFATTLDVDTAAAALQPMATGTGRADAHPSAGTGKLLARVDLHHDERLSATLVWTEAEPDPCPTRDLATMSVVNDALAACAVAELDRELLSVAM
jgi:hypothetical protein